MKKINISKNLKIGLISFTILITGILVFLISNEVKNPGFENQSVTLYNYNNQANIDYEVNVEPNILYAGRTIQAGETYISEFIDSIRTTFNYEFIGDSPIDLQGECEIIANVSGTSSRGQDEGNTTIWEKDFPLTKKTFTSNESNHGINETLSINYNEYNEFAKEALETSRVDTDVNLNVYMKVNIEGTNEVGTIEDTITSEIIIPLNTPIFEITSNSIEEQGTIEKTSQVQLPIDHNKVNLFGIIIGVCSLGLIFLIFFTKPAPKKDTLEIELDKIFKKHGDRLVALSSNVDISNGRLVRTIDDLVRLADEVNRPILYKYSDNYKDINKFFVTNEDEVYVFELKVSITKEEIIVKEEAAANSEQ